MIYSGLIKSDDLRAGRTDGDRRVIHGFAEVQNNAQTHQRIEYRAVVAIHVGLRRGIGNAVGEEEWSDELNLTKHKKSELQNLTAAKCASVSAVRGYVAMSLRCAPFRRAL